MADKQGKLIIFSAPSGSGKTTLVHHLLNELDNLSFSISATSRAPRGEEEHGKDYYFLSETEFVDAANNHHFLEWEEVYEGAKYGTLKAEVQRIWNEGKHVIFDIDVVGGLNLKKHFKEHALAIFVKVPSMKDLEDRLRSRKTEDDAKIEQRIAKANKETALSDEFDVIILNDNLDHAKEKAMKLVEEFIA